MRTKQKTSAVRKRYPVEKVKLDLITVKGLHSDLNYDIKLQDSGITLLTGPNGYGKTSILRLVDAVLGNHMAPLLYINFHKIVLKFSDGVSLSVRKQSQTVDRAKIYFGRGISGNEPVELQEPVEVKRRQFPDDEFTKGHGEQDLYFRKLLEDGTLRRIGTDRYQSRSGLRVTKQEAIRRYVTSRFRDEDRPTYPATFARDATRHSSELIYAQRLQSAESQPAVEEIANIIRDEIQAARNVYNDEGQRIDQEFPKKLLAKQLPRVTKADLDSRIQELSLQWEKYRELRLLAEPLSLPSVSDIPKLRLQVAGVYITTLSQKLAVFQEIEPRLTLFQALINEHLELGKKIHFSRERGLDVQKADGTSIPLSRLSSGEQHLFVLFGTLLFVRQTTSLMLIDEPELSLHPAWQESFLASIERIKKISSVDFILATHAPVLVANHLNLIVDLWRLHPENLAIGTSEVSNNQNYPLEEN